MKTTHQQGFTLIELMVVIAIIGILTVIAIPQYQTYTQRAEATTSIAGTRAVQLAIQEYYSTMGNLPTTLADLNRYAIDENSLQGIAATNSIIDSVAFEAVNDSDTAVTSIVITYDTVANGVPAGLAKKTLILLPAVTYGIVNFSVDTKNSTLDAKLRPQL